MQALMTLFPSLFRYANLEVDFRHRRVQVSGRTVHLTPLEYRVLSLLIDNADKVLTYDRLLRELWESHKRRQLQHIRVLMANLRRKLETTPSRPRHLVTAPGAGYQIPIERITGLDLSTLERSS